jgi:hypothetical protein
VKAFEEAEMNKEIKMSIEKFLSSFRYTKEKKL